MGIVADSVSSCIFLQKSKALIQKKEEGNQAFKSGHYEEAHKLYTEALEIDEYNKLTNAKLYNNRATVSAKVWDGSYLSWPAHTFPCT